LIITFLKTELIFLKQKNMSAREHGYWQKNKFHEKYALQKHYQGKYIFDYMDAFSSNINVWIKFIKKAKLDVKTVHYLEIGSFEGMSSVFILEKLPNACCTFVDPFESTAELNDSVGLGKSDFEKIYSNFQNNIKQFSNRASVFKQESNEFFKTNNNKFDFIYIDGSHLAIDVYHDAVNSFEALRDNGYIIFDDFFWFHYKNFEDNPIGGISKFLK
jgi:hypothetical protein